MKVAKEHHQMKGEINMAKRNWKVLGAIGMVTALLSGVVFAGSALADAYDDQYGDIADIARASQWATEEQGGWAGSSTVTCPGCGREVQSAYDTCPYCGTPLWS